ncbi:MULTISPECIES: CHAT domain-containing protein [Agrobacterium]|uniref:CHAT domain-containing protein n=2 Tax=Agrobacterium tumefaciens complex TaxID=1183400 RepID=A0AAE6BJ83_AGRTU|nr:MULTISPECIES: CHAT domain-containing protein [Agrobacterium]ASK40728.1 hypothetical protein [Agrobacterium genomosp. 6]ASK41491.1 hypothetical protein [Agrobacterium genomosp. 6]QCL77477.1 CHAT domain-containing protein [Agrobacterium tumefaciens]QCL82965.1 CHAT domain-containing protein [Agrobacterium tumefaciens]CUX71678.1 conserved hypothetical protein [Agrobacterium sp. NCPPB 925]
MNSDYYRGQLVKLQKDLSSLQANLSKEESAAGKARQDAASKRSAAAATKNISTAKSHVRAAESAEKKITTAQKSIAAISKKLADISNNIRQTQASLDAAIKRERAQDDRENDRRARKAKSERDAFARDTLKRRRDEIDHARKLAELSTITIRHILERPPEPEKLRVLYLTSSPRLDDPLRVDAEVNQVLRVLRGVRHRELIDLQHRPAATRQDLVDGINDVRPNVVHFSGHGNASFLLLDDGDFENPTGSALSFEELANILLSTDYPPTLVIINACQSAVGAHALLETVPIVIGTADGVLDITAGLFASTFYGAIGAGQSVGSAVDQARAVISSALPDEPDSVVVMTAGAVNIAEIVLVDG